MGEQSYATHRCVPAPRDEIISLLSAYLYKQRCRNIVWASDQPAEINKEKN